MLLGYSYPHSLLEPCLSSEEIRGAHIAVRYCFRIALYRFLSRTSEWENFRLGDGGSRREYVFTAYWKKIVLGSLCRQPDNPYPFREENRRFPETKWRGGVGFFENLGGFNSSKESNWIFFDRFLVKPSSFQGKPSSIAHQIL